MADSIKDNSNSTGTTPIVSTDASTSLNNGINPASSQTTTSADGTSDDKKDNSTSDGTSPTTNIDVKTNVTSSSTIESVPSQTATPINNTIDGTKDNSVDNSVSSGVASAESAQVQDSTANIGTRTNVPSSSSTSSSASISTVEVSTPNPAVKYSIVALIENSKALTGHKREVAVGALFNCNEKELTKESFKKLVEDFLQRKVK